MAISAKDGDDDKCTRKFFKGPLGFHEIEDSIQCHSFAHESQVKCERGSLLSIWRSITLSLSFSATNFSPGTAIDSSGLNQILSDRLWEGKDPIEL